MFHFCEEVIANKIIYLYYDHTYYRSYNNFSIFTIILSNNLYINLVNSLHNYVNIDVKNWLNIASFSFSIELDDNYVLLKQWLYAI